LLRSNLKKKKKKKKEKKKKRKEKILSERSLGVRRIRKKKSLGVRWSNWILPDSKKKREKNFIRDHPKRKKKKKKEKKKKLA
jgi:hypothetical protein